MTYSDRVFAEGKAEGAREMLLKLLSLRFGPLASTVTERVRLAAPETLERWLERALEAPRVDAVFDE